MLIEVANEYDDVAVFDIFILKFIFFSFVYEWWDDDGKIWFGYDDDLLLEKMEMWNLI